MEIIGTIAMMAVLVLMLTIIRKIGSALPTGNQTQTNKEIENLQLIKEFQEKTIKNQEKIIVEQEKEIELLKKTIEEQNRIIEILQ